MFWKKFIPAAALILALAGCGGGSGAVSSGAAVPEADGSNETAPGPAGDSSAGETGALKDTAPVPEYDYGDITDDGLIDIAPPPDGWEEDREAGVLTAGEWSDTDNWDYFQNVLNTAPDWDRYQQRWALYPTRRMPVRVRDGQKGVAGAVVTLLDGQEEEIWTSVTDAQGNASVFFGIFGDRQVQPARIRVRAGQAETEQAVGAQDLAAVFNLEQAHRADKRLDLMLVFDTTGSMGDELSYLQRELENVVERVRGGNANIPIRLSVNFYRDRGDEYIVRPFPFTDDIRQAVKQIGRQSAAGGGDYPEAVDMALENAVNGHAWSQDGTKLLFLILDAPPHHRDDAVETLHKAIGQASALGIRIIPVASSGVDKETEFLLRTAAVSTGGTYVFLTDDSGVGDSHLEPTIGNYRVEKLNRLLVKIINRYLAENPD